MANRLSAGHSSTKWAFGKIITPGRKGTRCRMSSKNNHKEPSCFEILTISWQEGFNLRSIMAYNQGGETRTNFYSSLAVLNNNIPTGTSRFSDFVFALSNQLSPLFHLRENNGRRLTEMRFAVANIGNESLHCPLQTNSSVDSGPGHQEILVAVNQNPSNPAVKEKPECRWDKT